MKRGHSVGDLHAETAQLLSSCSADKKLKRHNKQERQHHIDDVLSAVASNEGNNIVAAAVAADGFSTATKSTLATNEIAPLDVAPVVINNMMAWSRLVSECVAAQVLPLTSTIAALQAELQLTRATISMLSEQVTVIASTMSASTPHCSTCHPTDRPPASQTSSSPSQHATALNYAAAAGSTQSQSHNSLPDPNSQNTAQNTRQRHDPRHEQKQDAVTAMYLDLNRKQRRANNIVISGLPPSDNDTTAVVELLKGEYEWDLAEWPGVSVERCRRLGRQQDNKPQPLLVTLYSAQQAEYFTKYAKFLRDSSNHTVRSNVFINADQTPAEAKAAYELRVQRRQRAQRKQQRQDPSATRTFYRSRHETTAAADADEAVVVISPDRLINLRWRQSESSVNAGSAMASSTTSMAAPGFSGNVQAFSAGDSLQLTAPSSAHVQ